MSNSLTQKLAEFIAFLTMAFFIALVAAIIALLGIKMTGHLWVGAAGYLTVGIYGNLITVASQYETEHPDKYED